MRGSSENLTLCRLPSSNPRSPERPTLFVLALTPLQALQAATGQLRWSASTGGSIGPSPAVANGLVYVGSYDKKLYAFESSNGQVRWSASAGDSIHSSPAIANGMVYVRSDDYKLYAFRLG